VVPGVVSGVVVPGVVSGVVVPGVVSGIVVPGVVLGVTGVVSCVVPGVIGVVLGVIGVVVSGVVFGVIGVVAPGVVLGVVLLGVIVLGVVLLGVTSAGLVGLPEGVFPGTARPGAISLGVEGVVWATVKRESAENSWLTAFWLTSIEGRPNNAAPFAVTGVEAVLTVLGSFAFALSSPATSAIETDISGKRIFSAVFGREFKVIVE
jgi:hypothetical protein